MGEGEFATLVDDTGSTATFYFDTTATTGGETYAYQVKGIRGEDRSQASGQAQVLLDSETPDGESVVKGVLEVEGIAGESDSTHGRLSSSTTISLPFRSLPSSRRKGRSSREA